MNLQPLRPDYPCYLANRPVRPNLDLDVVDKYRQIRASRVPLADSALIDEAIGRAVLACGPMAAMAPFERRDVLLHGARRFRERALELASALCIEAGKPIRDSRGEVGRLIDTFEIAAREAMDIRGEVLSLETGERCRGYRGFTKRVPLGPCSFISPFNFPLNLAAHKIAPAIAAGCPFVLKPASLTPVGALLIGEVLAETPLPEGAFSILPASRIEAGLLATDERIKLLSFTGSPEAGWRLKSEAGKKRVVLELGGNAPCIVDAGADAEDAAARIVHGAFFQSGQSCISVQRILVHESLADRFESLLVEATSGLKCGDPASEDVFVGPMISQQEAERLERWIRSAVARGARVLCGGRRRGAILEPTLLRDVPPDEAISCEEAFGPVAVIDRFFDFDEALAAANRSRYGIHAGVFTPSIEHALRAFDVLETGGVLINEAPSWRADNMPYGGVKDSGLGREGVRYAIEDMTEIRTMVFRTPPQH